MTASKADQKAIEQYEHRDRQRLNNPPVGLVTPDTDQDVGHKTYAYDPHLDPQLVWAGKAEHTSFEVPTVSLHVHERIDPRTIIEAVCRRPSAGDPQQMSMFATPAENPPIREAIEFYRHSHNWTNRLIAGDSLLVMNSLLGKEGLAGQVQLIYIDPPYGIKYGSNFQPFVSKRDVTDGKDEDLTAEPEMVRAFRDTWELGIHSYLSYLRDRLLLARELLTESGSVIVQISDENVHRVRALMEEVFGSSNFVATVAYKTAIGMTSHTIDQIFDYLIWFARDKQKLKFRRLFVETTIGGAGATRYKQIESSDGKQSRLTTAEERSDPSLIPSGWRAYRDQGLTSRSGSDTTVYPIEYEGQTFKPSSGGWRTTQLGMQRLAIAGRLMVTGRNLSFKKFYDDFPALALANLWADTGGGITSRSDPKVYAVQTATTVIQRCLLMTTDPGDLVLDITCGSGTTAYVAEQWGRRWITCDTSRVAIALAKQRLMTAVYDYYELARPEEGVSSGFKYKTVPHVTLKSIANNSEIREGMTREEIDAAIAKYADQETLYDQPFVDRSKVRVTGPFTVEAVPAPTVTPLDDIDEPADHPADAAIARTGETRRQGDWRDELMKTGIRGKGGQRIAFSRVEPLAGNRWLHADAETKDDPPQRVAVSFGPEHAPLEQRQIALAIEEAQQLVPRPRIVVFAAFQFDHEAAKDIDETHWPGVTLLKAQMNADLLTEDLKKKRASNESFWLIGQPDVTLDRIADGPAAGQYRVAVHGFDYYNTRTGDIESGGTDKIAMWLLDTDYDGRSLFPRQVFFIADVFKKGLDNLARNLKAQIDEDLLQSYVGTVSLPFEPGKHRRVAVKIIDDRGIESLKLISLDD